MAKRAVKFISCHKEAEKVASTLLQRAELYCTRNGIDINDSAYSSFGGSVGSKCPPSVAFDIEGSALGRFGKACLLQIASRYPTEDSLVTNSDDTGGFTEEIILADALRDGVVDAFRPLLEHDNVLKIMHDCREDSAALYHQHNIELQGVYDVQTAHAELLRSRGEPIYHCSSADLLAAYNLMEHEDEGIVKAAKTAMKNDPLVFSYCVEHL
mgnify:CR=1 FL=1